jgi:hypothetical protein
MANRSPSEQKVLVDTAILADTAILDQGYRPVCAAMAATTVHEAARDNSETLAPEALWQHALARGVAGDRGTTFEAMADALGETGQPSESRWPFDQTDFGVQSAPATAGPPPWYVAVLSAQRMSAAEVADKLLDGIPVAAAMDIYESFYEAGVTGTIEEPLPDERGQGRHAVVCVGYAYAGSQEDTLYLLIRNSWGAGWGLEGHAWIAAETFDRVCDGTAIAVAS